MTVVILWPAAGHSGPCDSLSAEQKKIAQKFFQETHPYDCCDETLDRCLQQKRICRLANRLRNTICLRLGKGQVESEIKAALEKRARSMTMVGPKATFDLSLAPLAGETKAMVTVVMYACTRCPMCRREVSEIYQMVTTGPLKGKVKLYLRPYPIRNHEGSAEGGQALLAAARLKKFWPYVLKVYAEFDRYAVDKLPEWAAAVGMDRELFRREYTSPQIRNLVVESKKEGIRNGAISTPTLFINGRKYQGSFDSETLVDILDEEGDRLTGRQY